MPGSTLRCHAPHADICHEPGQAQCCGAAA
jgi:hypothetical protein